jgi:hypothetical protein
VFFFFLKMISYKEGIPGLEDLLIRSKECIPGVEDFTGPYPTSASARKVGDCWWVGMWVGDN